MASPFIFLLLHSAAIRPQEAKESIDGEDPRSTSSTWSYISVFQTSLKGATLTWYGGLPPRSIDIFDTLIECFSVQYATNKSHCMTSATLSSLQQEDDESLRKFMDRFGPTAIQIWNLKPEVALHLMLLSLPPASLWTVYAKNLSVAWMSCTSKPRATSGWKI